MLHDATPATDKRAAFSAALASGRLLRFPGAFSPLSAMLIARHHFDGVYVSGADLSADLGLPQLGLTTLTEVAERAGQIARVTHLPALADAGAGFGEPMHTARTVQILEDAGVAGVHLSDQGGRDATVRRITAAVAARRDPGFVIAAGASPTLASPAPAGPAVAIDDAKAYADAGADLICPGDLTAAAELERFRAEVDEPLLVDMTGFGRGRRLTARTLQSLGINVAIYPALLLQQAVAAGADVLAQLAAEGPAGGASADGGPADWDLAGPAAEQPPGWRPRHSSQPDLLGHLLRGSPHACIHDLVG
jgi:methylisocitrate lyase